MTAPAFMQRSAWPIPTSLILLGLVPAVAGISRLAQLAGGAASTAENARFVEMPVALTGLWMAHFYPWPVGDGVGVYVERLLVGAAMATSIVLGVRAVLRRDFAAHGAWMTRAYALGLGAGTQVLTHLPWFVFVGKPGETARTVLMGAGWAINIVVAEWLIRAARRTRSARFSESIHT